MQWLAEHRRTPGDAASLATAHKRILGPMYLSRPSAMEVRRAIDAVREADFDHPHVGATASTLPAGWHHDEQSRVVGSGPDDWEAAVRALRGWTQFDLDWVWPHDATTPIEAGAAFGFVSRQLGVWTVNVCRIAYVVDERGGEEGRFGFGYGTVGSHVVRGEELFVLERDASGAVRFTIRKFSRPAHPLVAMGLPVALRVQRRFSADALARLAREVHR